MRRTLAKIARKFLPCDAGLNGTGNVVRQSIMQGQDPERYQSISRNIISSEEGDVFEEEMKDKTPTKPRKKGKKKTVVIYL
jgi:hypothetical protein